jgi:alkanesulfonate monooxygenase SsuD/methylene tetrahydromethanopterin reductase-like flavin-dependent oxidoreductase (luciferase family)
MVGFGSQINNSPISNTGDLESLLKITLELERLGFDSAWNWDHMVISLGSDYLKIHKEAPLSAMASPVLECWTMLSWLAANTRKIRLGPLTVGNLFRYPSVLAKTTSSFDVVSNGRLEFGIGTGYWKAEHEMYGIPLQNLTTRIERLAEAVEIIKSMWTKDVTDFEGKYYTMKQALCNPKPLQKPHPPILIGGRSQGLMKLAAKLADNWNVPFALSVTPEEYGEMADRFDDYCRQVGRSPKDIVKSIGIRCIIDKNPEKVREKAKRLKPEWETMDGFMKRLIGTPEQCVEKLNSFKDKGMGYFIVQFLEYGDLKSMELFAEEVIPAVK